MNRFILLTILILNSSQVVAGSPGEYLQQSLIGTEVNARQVSSVKVDCSKVHIVAEKSEAEIPVNAVTTIIYFGDSIGFACINGGGCIQTSEKQGVNDLNISKLVADGLKQSVVNAFKLHQKACGGTVKRPY